MKWPLFSLLKGSRPLVVEPNVKLLRATLGEVAPQMALGWAGRRGVGGRRWSAVLMDALSEAPDKKPASPPSTQKLRKEKKGSYLKMSSWVLGELAINILDTNDRFINHKIVDRSFDNRDTI